MHSPSISDYINAFKFAPDIFSKNSTLFPCIDDKGDLIFSTGIFSVVFKMVCKETGKNYAIKVFHRHQEGRTESYKHINKHINNSESPYLVHYDYCENEIEVDGHEYPALIMEWIEGLTLGKFLSELVQNEDKDGIFQLACNFDKMAVWLLEQPFAHGDLKTDNILIDENGTLRLIDYDGMFTPEMQGQHARENGSPGFRHPGRLPEHFGQHIDDFSILLISFSIHALAVDTGIVENINFGDSLLFTEDSLKNLNFAPILNSDILRTNTVTSSRMVMLQMSVGNPATIRLFGLQQIITANGNHNIPLLTNFEYPDSEFEKFWKGSFCSFRIKKTGIIVSNIIFDDALPFCDGIAFVKLNGLWGGIDKNGVLRISHLFHSVKSFSEGLACVELDRCYGFINKDGKEIIPLKYDYADSFHEGLATVKINDKWGYISTDGKLVIPLIYPWAGPFCEGLALVESSIWWGTRGKYGYIDKYGETVISFIFDSAESFKNGVSFVRIINKYEGYIDRFCNLIKNPMVANDEPKKNITEVKINSVEIVLTNKVDNPAITYKICHSFDNISIICKQDKYGMINKKGHLVAPIIYESYDTYLEGVDYSPEGLLSFKLHGKWGFLNFLGELVIPFKYDSTLPFTEGLARVGIGNKYAYIDKQGHSVTQFKYDFADIFEYGLARVEIKGKKGFINRKGEEIVPIKYDIVESCYAWNKGLAWVGLNDVFGFIDKKGNEVTPIIYDEAGPFIDGICWLKVDWRNTPTGCGDRYCFITITGKQITPLKYSKVSDFYNGLAIIYYSGGQPGLINRAGKEICGEETYYSQIYEFQEGFAKVVDYGKYGFIDKRGREKIPLIYDEASNFKDGLALVTLNKKSGFINKAGLLIIPLIYDTAGGFSEGLSLVKTNEKYGFIDKEGKVILPQIYDKASMFSRGLSRVNLNNKWGFINKQGIEIIPILYEEAEFFKLGLSKVKLNNKYGFIDIKGEVVIAIKYVKAEPFDDFWKTAIVWSDEKIMKVDINGNEIEYELIF
jgi:serine/threonine protein kinase